MDIEQLNYFKKIAELEHMTKAAEALYISQPALSLSIQRLEAELEVPLLERSGRNIHVNEYGKILLSHIDPILEHYNLIKDEIHDRQVQEYNTITICSCSLFRFPGLVDEIVASYPDVVIDYINYNRKEMERNLLSGNLDFCISPYTFKEPIESVLLSTSEAVIIAGRGNPITNIVDPTIDDFNSQPFVIYNHDFPLREWQDSMMESLGLSPKCYALSKGSKDSVSAVRTGKYLAIIPEAIVQDLISLTDFHIYPLHRPDICWRHVLSTNTAIEKRQIVKDIESIIKKYFES